jgi:hypothetical protein
MLDASNFRPAQRPDRDPVAHHAAEADIRPEGADA